MTGPIHPSSKEAGGKSFPIPESGDVVQSTEPLGVFGLSMTSAHLEELAVVLLGPFLLGEIDELASVLFLLCSLAKQKVFSKILEILFCHCCLVGESILGAFRPRPMQKISLV